MRAVISTLLLGTALVLPGGCVTGSELAKEEAFQACRNYAGTDKFSACAAEQRAAYTSKQTQRAAEFEKLQSDCDDKRAKAAALGASTDDVLCQGDSPLQYAIDGVN